MSAEGKVGFMGIGMGMQGSIEPEDGLSPEELNRAKVGVRIPAGTPQAPIGCGGSNSTVK